MLNPSLPYLKIMDKAWAMPEISRFFGNIIRMYMEAGQPHNTPHFHAHYQGFTAVYTTSPVEQIVGALPRRQRRMVMAWAEIHHEELKRDWDNLQNGALPYPIDPLK